MRLFAIPYRKEVKVKRKFWLSQKWFYCFEKDDDNISKTTFFFRLEELETKSKLFVFVYQNTQYATNRIDLLIIFFWATPWMQIIFIVLSRITLHWLTVKHLSMGVGQP